jgi:hypothetical protein
VICHRHIGKKPADLYLTQHFHDAAGHAEKQGLPWQQANADWSGAFHTFAVEVRPVACSGASESQFGLIACSSMALVQWVPDTVTYFVDGAQVHQQASLFAPTPMDIAFGVGTGDCGQWSWVGCPSDAPAGSEEPLPSRMRVKDLKIFEYIGALAPATEAPTAPTGYPTAAPTIAPTEIPYRVLTSEQDGCVLGGKLDLRWTVLASDGPRTKVSFAVTLNGTAWLVRGFLVVSQT